MRPWLLWFILALGGVLAGPKQIPLFKWVHNNFKMNPDADPGAVSARYITQPLDHNRSTNETFLMRYFTNHQFFLKDNSPIFIMIGGEDRVDLEYVTSTQTFEIARDVGAYLISTEHRFYGDPLPVMNSSTENLKFLTVDQALADVVALVKMLKQEPRFANSKVIVFGGSYSGGMATWIRLKHPDVIDGAVSSSGIALAKAEVSEYMEAVRDAIQSYGGRGCMDVITEGIAAVKQLLLTKEGAKDVSELFGTCSTINTTNPLDVQTFFATILRTLSGLAQIGAPGKIETACAILGDATLGTPAQRLAHFVVQGKGNDSCYMIVYQDMVDVFADTSFDDPSIVCGRLWYYQSCTQFGFFQTTTTTVQSFGDVLPLSFWLQHLCPDFYGQSVNSDVLAAGVERTNREYGGLTPNVTKVIFVHGTLDPWHRLGIVEDLSEESPAILVQGIAHMTSLMGTSDTDSPALTQARQRVREMVLKWISE